MRRRAAGSLRPPTKLSCALSARGRRRGKAVFPPVTSPCDTARQAVSCAPVGFRPRATAGPAHPDARTAHRTRARLEHGGPQDARRAGPDQSTHQTQARTKVAHHARARLERRPLCRPAARGRSPPTGHRPARRRPTAPAPAWNTSIPRSPDRAEPGQPTRQAHARTKAAPNGTVST